MFLLCRRRLQRPRFGAQFAQALIEPRRFSVKIISSAEYFNPKYQKITGHI
jgi:hypothetical protein